MNKHDKQALKLVIIVVLVVLFFIGFVYLDNKATEDAIKNDYCRIDANMFITNCIDLVNDINITKAIQEMNKTCTISFYECRFIVEQDILYVGVKKDNAMVQLKFKNNTHIIRRI